MLSFLNNKITVYFKIKVQNNNIQKYTIQVFSLSYYSLRKKKLKMMFAIFGSIMFKLWFWFPNFMNNSIKTINFIRFVFNYSGCSVGFFEGISTFNFISITFFILLFFVSSMGIVNSIVELIFRWFLQINTFLNMFVLINKKTHMNLFISGFMSTVSF